MQPIPCAHCGINFMRQTPKNEQEKLCNNCSIREEIRNQNKEKKMDTVDILIKCSRETQIEIEEICINQGIDFSKYFIDLHTANTTYGWKVESSEDHENEEDDNQKNKKKKKKD